MSGKSHKLVVLLDFTVPSKYSEDIYVQVKTVCQCALPEKLFEKFAATSTFDVNHLL